MKKITILLLFISQYSFAQQAAQATGCADPAFNNEVLRYLDLSIPVVTPQQIKDSISQYLVLDIREKKEYNVSHIPDAVHLGYDRPKWKVLKEIDKDRPIIVYCSIGYRSEKVGEQLLEKGFTNVTNLYGSIFEWVNQGLPLYDKKSQPTKKVHGYNKDWSQWIKNPEYEIEY